MSVLDKNTLLSFAYRFQKSDLLNAIGLVKASQNEQKFQKKNTKIVNYLPNPNYLVSKTIIFFFSSAFAEEFRNALINCLHQKNFLFLTNNRKSSERNELNMCVFTVFACLGGCVHVYVCVCVRDIRHQNFNGNGNSNSNGGNGNSIDGCIHTYGYKQIMVTKLAAKVTSDDGAAAEGNISTISHYPPTPL